MYTSGTVWGPVVCEGRIFVGSAPGAGFLFFGTKYYCVCGLRPFGCGSRFWSYTVRDHLACENIRFSSLFAAGDVSRGGTSATQRQKFHTDDANQCLHNKSGSDGVPIINLICLILRVFWSILVKCCVDLPTNSSKIQMLLQQKFIFHKN